MKLANRWTPASFLFVCALALQAAQTPPMPVQTPSPVYPAELAESGRPGTAMIDCVIKADGTVADARVKSADHEAFGRAALAAIGEWKFEPATSDGVAVDRRVTIPFKFAVPPLQQLNAVLKRKVYQEIPHAVLTQKEYGKKLQPVKPLRQLVHPSVKSPGSVSVRFVVGPDGATLNPDILGEVPREIVLPLIARVAQASFQPPMKDGKPVYVEVRTKVAFMSPEHAAKRKGGGGPRRGGGGGGAQGGGGGGGPDE